MCTGIRCVSAWLALLADAWLAGGYRVLLSNSPFHHCDEGRRHALAAIVEQALVDEGEQRVQNGAVGLRVSGGKHRSEYMYSIALKHEPRDAFHFEDLVDEGDLGLGQVARSVAFILVLLESPHGKWPEELLMGEERFRERKEAVLLYVGVVENSTYLRD